MKVLVTGAGGFIGKNLTLTLEQAGHEVLGTDIDTPAEELERACAQCEFVFHLAGVNRPKDDREFASGNLGSLSRVLSLLEGRGNRCPVMLSSSTQAERDNPYGLSKRAAEEELMGYGARLGIPVYPFRFPNVYGKWCRPGYNSAIATFCYNIARGLPITVNDESAFLTLAYIDDVCACLLDALHGDAHRDEAGLCSPKVTDRATLGEIVALLYAFRDSRKSLEAPDMSRPLERKLYATYLSFLPPEELSYPLTMHADARGSFTEMLRSPDRGQVSVNIIRPGVVKGNHWHHTKNEKFLVVAGEGTVRLRSALGGPVTEHRVSGECLQVVDIPPGYTHNIENLGQGDMVTVMWASEPFDPQRPDTVYLQV